MLMRAGADGAELRNRWPPPSGCNGTNFRPSRRCWTAGMWRDGRRQAEGVGGAFHDWFCLPDGLLAVAVGKAAEQGDRRRIDGQRREDGRARPRPIPPPGRTHPPASQPHALDRFGRRPTRRALFCGLIETATGRVCCARQARPSVLRLLGDGWQSLSQSSARLGESPESRLRAVRPRTAAGRGVGDSRRWPPRRSRRRRPAAGRGRPWRRHLQASSIFRPKNSWPRPAKPSDRLPSSGPSSWRPGSSGGQTYDRLTAGCGSGRLKFSRERSGNGGIGRRIG